MITNLIHFIGYFIIICHLFSLEGLCASADSSLGKTDKTATQSIEEEVVERDPCYLQRSQKKPEHEHVKLRVEIINEKIHNVVRVNDNIEYKSRNFVSVRRKLRSSLNHEGCEKKSHESNEQSLSENPHNNNSESNNMNIRINETDELCIQVEKVNKFCHSGFNFKMDINFIMDNFKNIAEHSFELDYVHITEKINPSASELLNVAIRKTNNFFDIVTPDLDGIKDIIHGRIINVLNRENLNNLDDQYNTVHSSLLEQNQKYTEEQLEKILPSVTFELNRYFIVPDEKLFASLHNSITNISNELALLKEEFIVIYYIFSSMDCVIHKILYNSSLNNKTTEEKLAILEYINNNFKRLIQESELANAKGVPLNNWKLVSDTYIKLNYVLNELQKEYQRSMDHIVKTLLFKNSHGSSTILEIFQFLINFLRYKNLSGKIILTKISKDTKYPMIFRRLNSALDNEEKYIMNFADKIPQNYLNIFPTSEKKIMIFKNKMFSPHNDPFSNLPSYFANIISVEHFLLQFRCLKNMIDKFTGISIGELIEKEKDNKELKFDLEFQVTTNSIEFLKYNFWFFEGRMSGLLFSEKMKYKFLLLHSRIKGIYASLEEINLYLNDATNKYNSLMKVKDRINDEEMQLRMKDIFRSLYFIYKSFLNLNRDTCFSG